MTTHNTNVSNGQSTLTLNTSNMNPGVYNIITEYTDNNYYDGGSDGVGTLTVKATSTITTNIENINVFHGDSVTIIGSLQADGSALQNKRVALVDYDNITTLDTTYTGSNGSFSFTVTMDDMNANGNNLYIKYFGEEIVLPYSKAIPVTLKHTTHIVSFNSLTIYFGSSTTITGTLYDESNNPVASKTIKLMDYDGETVITTATTENNGTFAITYTPDSWDVNGGDVYLVFDGTNDYKTSSKIIGVTLLKHEITITLNEEEIEAYVGDTFRIIGSLTSDVDIPVYGTVLLYNADGSECMGESSIRDNNFGFVLECNDETETEYLLKFEGNEYFKPATKTVTITVLKLDSLVKFTLLEPSGDNNGTITVNVPRDATGTVTVNIATLDPIEGYVLKGRCRIIIEPMLAGRYTVDITYNGDSKYKSSTASTTMTVFRSKSLNI